ncbi:MAG: sporulation protein YunB [Oscillospiraceae bacterium]|nr:sporulation protein YunB [Oscillospiraceae bacterium]
MRRMRRRKRLITVFLLVILLVGMLFLLILRLKIAPMMEELVMTQAQNTMSTMVNRIVNEQIAAGTIDYDRMIYFEKDVDGGITALKTNMGEINRLKTEILVAMNREIQDISVGTLDIPIGNFFMPELFSGKGFKLPVRILSVSTSDATFHNQFSEAGINQTLHQITMDVCINLTVMTPTGSVKTQVVTDMVVAETVIVGSVPQSYVNIGDVGIDQDAPDTNE